LSRAGQLRGAGRHSPRSDLFSVARYDVRFIDIGHIRQSDATFLSHGDKDDRASERECLASAPALSERRRRLLARVAAAQQFGDSSICPDRGMGK
jgi:hypothetical protein